jgi:hypothetical protein
VQDDAPAEQGEYGAARLVCAPAFTESGPELDMTAATAGLPGTRRYEPIGRPAIRHATPRPNGCSVSMGSHMPIASVGIPIRRSDFLPEQWKGCMAIVGKVG